MSFPQPRTAAFGRFRVALTLVCLWSTALAYAAWSGMLPALEQQLSKGRIALAESLAITGTAMVAEENAAGFEATLAALVRRNHSVNSVRLLDSNGGLRFETEGHGEYWSPRRNGPSASMSVPIYRFGGHWGVLQIAFTRIDSEIGLTTYRAMALIGCIMPLCIVAVVLVLERIAPSSPQASVVQDDANSLMDQFVRRSHCLDNQNRVPIANRRCGDAIEESPCESGESPQWIAVEPGESLIHCTFPLDDDEYCDIVLDFVRRLDIRLMKMLSMLHQRAFDSLASEAHWLKGVGGTVGYPNFTRPATDLLNAARQSRTTQCQEAIQALLDIRRRLVVPTTTSCRR